MSFAYMGSKKQLLDYIKETIDELGYEPSETTVCDIFSGAGHVSRMLKESGYNVISNDIQAYSYYMLRYLMKFNKPVSEDLLSLLDMLNKIKGKKGFIYYNYAPTGSKDGEYQRMYFTDENAMKIDGIRQCINQMIEDGIIDDSDFDFFIASLLSAVPKVSNSMGHYSSFAKTWKAVALKELTLNPEEAPIGDGVYEVYNKNANDLIREIKGDILYLDPPYNQRQYNVNYHMLETIALYDNPKVSGVVGRRDEPEEKGKSSDYSRRRKARQALEDLISHANFDYVVMSYSNDGIIPLEDIESIMSRYGEYTRKEQEHRRFKSNSTVKMTEPLVEYLHILKVDKSKIKY